MEIPDKPPTVPGGSIERAKDPPLLQTQLAISATIGILAFLYFCAVRTKWTSIYAPRTKLKGRSAPKLPDSFFGWIFPLIRIPEDQVLRTIGLDAAMLLTFFKMVIKLFSLLILIGLPFLIPIKQYAPDDPDNDETLTLLEFFKGDKKKPQLDDTTNPYLVAHLIFTYLFTFITAFFLYVGFRDFIVIRRIYFLELSQNLASRTVMVEYLPKELRSEKALATFMESLGIGSVESAFVSRHVDLLGELIQDRMKVLNDLENSWVKYLGNPVESASYDPDALMNPDHPNVQAGLTSSRSRPTRRLTLFGESVDEIDYLQKKYLEIDAKVESARQNMRTKPSSTGFVTFEDMASAQISAQTLLHPAPGKCIADLAPEARDVYWPNINLSARNVFIRKCVVNAILFVVTFFWASPIAFIASFLDIRTLRKVWPALAELAEINDIAGAIITGFLPTVVVLLFVSVLPIVMEYLSQMEGLKARSWIELSTMKKYYFFLYVYLILVFALIPGLGNTFWAIVGDPSSIASRLAVALRKLSKHYMDLIIYQGLALYPLQLVQAGRLLLNWFYRMFARTPRDYAEINAPPTINFGILYPLPIVIFCICITYSVISPIILVFGLVYFAFGYIVLKYQFLYVYFKPYESIGQAWPITFRMMIVGLLTFQLFMAGLFSLQKAFYLSAGATLLIILTLWWAWYMLDMFDPSVKYIPLHSIRDLGKLPLNGASRDQDILASTIAGEDTESEEEDGQVASTRTKRILHTLTGGIGSSLPRLITHTTTGISPPSKLVHRGGYYEVADEELYSIEADKMTDYSQPPMTSFNYYSGVLSSGVRRYGHPALIGRLPEPWLPIKTGGNGLTADTTRRLRRRSTRSRRKSLIGPQDAGQMAENGQNGTDASTKLVDVVVEPEPSSSGPPAPEPTFPVEDTGANNEETSDAEDDVAPQHRQYIHHPERRSSIGAPLRRTMSLPMEDEHQV